MPFKDPEKRRAYQNHRYHMRKTGNIHSDSLIPIENSTPVVSPQLDCITAQEAYKLEEWQPEPIEKVIIVAIILGIILLIMSGVSWTIYTING